jgi:hypothetical protein
VIHNNKALALLGAISIAISSGASAGSLEDRLSAMEQRMSSLEQLVQQQAEVIQQKEKEITELQESAAPDSSGGNGWFEKVEVGGVVEVEANHSSPQGAADSSDINVATVEIGIAAQVNDWVAAEIVWLYEDDGSTQFDVDSAVISIADPDASWYVNSGLFAVPFGVFASNMVSDPLTLDLAETYDSAIQVGYATDGLDVSAYVFKGDFDNNQIGKHGFAIGYEGQTDGFAFAGRVGYISDLLESDALVDNLNTAAITPADEMPAWTASAEVVAGAFALVAEYVKASDSFSNYGNQKPAAFNIEIAYGFEAVGKPATFAIGYQGTDAASNAGWGFVEKRLVSALSMEIHSGTTIALEYMNEEDYAGVETDTVTGQLAVEF